MILRFVTIDKFAITRKNDAFLAKIGNKQLTKIFVAIFATNFCHPVLNCFLAPHVL